jgi:hypothetical protein
VRQFIRPVGVELLMLPKYSPDLNPIEQDLVKLEHLLRNAAARTLDGIGQLLEAYTLQECANIVGWNSAACSFALGTTRWQACRGSAKRHSLRGFFHRWHIAHAPRLRKSLT